MVIGFIEVCVAILVVAGGVAVLVETLSEMKGRTPADHIRERTLQLKLERDRRQSLAWAQAAFQARVRTAQGVGVMPRHRQRKAG